MKVKTKNMTTSPVDGTDDLTDEESERTLSVAQKQKIANLYYRCERWQQNEGLRLNCKIHVMYQQHVYSKHIYNLYDVFDPDE